MKLDTIPLHLERPLRVPPLAASELRVYRASIGALTPHREELSSLLSEEEMLRAKAYRLARPRERFESVRGTLRVLLAALLECDPCTVTIERNAEGKPHLRAAHAPALHFNVSHSGDLAVFAFGLSAPLGVDVEYIDHAIDAEVVMRTAFSESERNACRASDQAQTFAQFFQIWTRKEARIKACGLAMAHPFFASVEQLPVVDLELSDEYAGALAVCHDTASPPAEDFPSLPKQESIQ